MFPVIQKFIIDPYYKDHPGEDREAKRALNIEDEEMAAEDEEEAIFQDLGNEQREEEEETAPKRELPKQYNEQELPVRNIIAGGAAALTTTIPSDAKRLRSL